VIRVVIVDDQVLLRAGLRALLESAGDITVVGEAGDGAEGIDVVTAVVPDVVLMDIRMPAVDGLTATSRIVAAPELSAVRVVILTTFELDEYIFEAIRAGASGFMVKDTEPAEVIRAVRTVAAGDALLSPGATRAVIAQYAEQSKPAALAPSLGLLTEREREVMSLVAGGLSNDEIAQQLVISPATAKTHVSRAMTKLNARDRAQLVVFAYETGLVTPHWSGGPPP
jgi:DNA-binding NarL/FixJ family response regulator